MNGLALISVAAVIVAMLVTNGARSKAVNAKRDGRMQAWRSPHLPESGREDIEPRLGAATLEQALAESVGAEAAPKRVERASRSECDSSHRFLLGRVDDLIASLDARQHGSCRRHAQVRAVRIVEARLVF